MITDAPETKATLADWLAVASAIVGAFTAILDIQITNSSLANIEGAIGASAEQGSWISTAYLMAEIVVLARVDLRSAPLSVGRYRPVRRLLNCLRAVDVAGAAYHLTRGARFTGGVLIPTAVTIIRTRLPKSQQGLGITFFGLTATFAPAIGPTIGGWLTDNFSWHYIFYLNLVPDPIAAILQLIALPKQRARWGDLPKGDWFGIAAMAIGLSSLTCVLEEGQLKEWLESDTISRLTIVAAVGISCFLLRELTAVGLSHVHWIYLSIGRGAFSTHVHISMP